MMVEREMLASQPGPETTGLTNTHTYDGGERDVLMDKLVLFLL